MFIKFEGRLINVNEIQYTEKRKSLISSLVSSSPIICIHLKHQMSLEICYQNESKRDTAYTKLEELLVK